MFDKQGILVWSTSRRCQLIHTPGICSDVCDHHKWPADTTRRLRMKPLVGIEFVFLVCPCLFLSPGAPPLLSCLGAGARPRQCVWSKTKEKTWAIKTDIKTPPRYLDTAPCPLPGRLSAGACRSAAPSPILCLPPPGFPYSPLFWYYFTIIFLWFGYYVTFILQLV